MSRENRFVPGGTAREAWLRASGHADAGLANDVIAPGAANEEEFEPAYFGWEIARCAPGLTADEQRLLAALAAGCMAAMRSGSTRLPLTGASLAPALAAWGAPDGLTAARVMLDRARSERAEAGLATVIGGPGDRRPLILDGDFLYTERMHALEERFCARIRERAVRRGRLLEGRPLARAMASVAAGPPISVAL